MRDLVLPIGAVYAWRLEHNYKSIVIAAKWPRLKPKRLFLCEVGSKTIIGSARIINITQPRPDRVQKSEWRDMVISREEYGEYLSRGILPTLVCLVEYEPFKYPQRWPRFRMANQYISTEAGSNLINNAMELPF